MLCYVLSHNFTMLAHRARISECQSATLISDDQLTIYESSPIQNIIETFFWISSLVATWKSACLLFICSHLYCLITKYASNLVTQQRISTPLMMENPVRSPMVPPKADNWSTNFAALSLVILSNVGVSKYILTYLNLFFHS